MTFPIRPSKLLCAALLLASVGLFSVHATAATADHCPTTRFGPSQGLRALVNCAGKVEFATERGGRLSLRTVAFGRGATIRSLTPLGLVTQGDDVCIERSGAVEHIRPVSDGFEQSWELTAPPPGAGDLLVQVAVQGAAPVSLDSRGTLLRVAKSGDRVRYGQATWIDANGRRAPVAARWNGGIEIVVPEALLESSSYPAVLDPVVDVETETDAPQMAPVGSIGGYGVSTAFDGTNYLAVWLDMRHCLPTTTCDHRLFAARLSPQGDLLDPTGITLLAENVRSAAVAFGADTYLVVYASSIPLAGDDNIFARRVSLDGSLPDASPHPLATDPHASEGNPAVGFDGTNFFAVWDTDGAFGGTITGVRISPAGLVVGSAQAISDGAPSHLAPQVAYGGSSLLVTYGNEDTDEIIARTVGSDGLPSADAVNTGAHAWRYSLAAGADRFLLAGTTTASSPVYAQLLDATGTPIVTTPIAASADSPHAAFDGTSFVVLWEPYNAQQTVRASRVEADGSIGTPADVLVATNEADHYVMGLQGGADPLLVTVATPMGTAGRWLPIGLTSAGAEFAIAQSANAQWFPSVAARADQYLVTWEDMRTGDPAIFAVRHDASGVPIDAEAFAVNDDPGEQTLPLVASNGTDYFVAWNDADGLRGTLVTSDGTIGSAHGAALKVGDVIGARLAGSAMGFVAAFVDALSDDPDLLTTVRIDASGAPSAPQVVAQPISGTPAIAASAAGYLVAWFDPQELQLRAKAYDADGTELGSATLGGAYDFQPSVSAASDDSGFLVVGQSASNYGAGLVGWILDGAGQLVGSQLEIADGSLVDDDVGWDLSEVGVSFDGRSYVVTWPTLRYVGDAVGEVMAAWIATDGTVLSEPTGFELLSEGPRPRRAMVAGGRQGRSLVAVNRYLDEVDHRSFRVSTVLVTNDYELPAPGGAGGAGGGAATGGAAAGGGGEAGSPGTPPSGSSDSDEGCGCRLAVGRGRFSAVWPLLGGIGLACVRRRRSRLAHRARSPRTAG